MNNNMFPEQTLFKKRLKSIKYLLHKVTSIMDHALPRSARVTELILLTSKKIDSDIQNETRLRQKISHLACGMEIVEWKLWNHCGYTAVH